MKGELGFVGLRAKNYSYLIDACSEHKKAKGPKNCVIKINLQFENCKNCLEATQLDNKINYHKDKEFIKTNKLILKTQQRFKSERHNVFTKEINKMALSSNDYKAIQ